MRGSGWLDRHGVHPVLIVVPLGLFGISVVFDIIGMLSASSVWGVASAWNIGAGVVAGLIAFAGFGRELRATPFGARLRFMRLAHWLLWGTVLLLFTQSLALRVQSETHMPPAAAIGLSILSLSLSIVAGFMGEALDRRPRITL